jgi:peptidoglycan-N-acetylglucosamine deacetylase
MDIFLAVVLGLVLLLLFEAVFLPHRLIRLLAKALPGIVWHGRGDAPLVALTLDDGPDPVYTPQILNILSRERIPATFFLVGERVRRYPEVVSQICAQGHEIGNHSDSWARTLSLSLDVFDADLKKAERTLSGLPGSARFFRPAGVWIRPSQLRLLRKFGYACVLGSAYAHDPARPPAGYIARTIVRALRPGAIIVVHDSGGDRSATVEALPAILKGAQAKGLSFVRLSTLLKS